MAGTDGRNPSGDYKCLLRELECYSKELAAKPRFIVANKMDAPASPKNFTALKRIAKCDILPISCLDGTGLDALKEKLGGILLQPRPF